MRAYKLIILAIITSFSSWAQTLDTVWEDIEKGNFDLARSGADRLKTRWINDSDGTEKLSGLGDIYEKLGNFDNNLDVRRQAFLNIKESSETSETYLLYLAGLGKAYRISGNYFLASKIAGRISELQLLANGKKSSSYAKALTDEGVLLLNSGQLKQAENKYAAAYNIVEQGDNDLNKGIILSRYAHFLTEFGVYTAAENYFRQAFFIFNAKGVEGESQDIFEAYVNIAELYMRLNNLDQARKNLLLAEEILLNFPQNHPNWLVHRSVLLILSIREDSKSSTDTIIQSLQVSEHPDVFIAARIKRDIAKGKIFQGNVADAQIIVDELISELRETTGDYHYLIPELLDISASIKSQNKNHISAVQVLNEARLLRRDILDFEHPDYLNNLSSLSLSYWALGNTRLAERYFTKALFLTKIQYQKQFTFLSGSEKELFYGNIRSYFNKFNNFVLDNYKRSPSLITSSINNQLLFKGLLFNSTRNLKEKVYSDKRIYEKYERYVSAREKLSVAYKAIEKGLGSNVNLDSLENVANYLEKEISLRVNLGGNQKDSERLYRTWENIRETLDRDEAAIEIIRINPYSKTEGVTDYEKSSYMVLFFSRSTKGRPEVLVLENGTDLDGRNLNFYRRAIQLQVEDDNSYEQYWKPIAEAFDLDKYNKIYVSPDGVYNLLSLNTLFDPPNQNFILDKYQLTIVGNLSDVIETKTVNRNRVKDNDPLFVGFPEYNKPLIDGLEEIIVKESSNNDSTRSFYNSDGGINMLPGTLAEIQSITEILTNLDHDFEKLTGLTAREDTLKSKTSETISPRIVHVATHGFFLDPGEDENEITDPLALSGILLSGAAFSDSEMVLNKQIRSFGDDKIFDDGVLFAQEAMNLNLLTTELVVLSACETGLGVVRNGEGVYGLQRAFQTAGANSVIMSLWKVDDQATNQFMTSFYREWIRSGDKRNSFAVAQKEIRQQFSHPFYWGAFVMIGQ